MMCHSLFIWEQVDENKFTDRSIDPYPPITANTSCPVHANHFRYINNRHLKSLLFKCVNFYDFLYPDPARTWQS